VAREVQRELPAVQQRPASLPGVEHVPPVERGDGADRHLAPEARLPDHQLELRMRRWKHPLGRLPGHLRLRQQRQHQRSDPCGPRSRPSPGCGSAAGRSSTPTATACRTVLRRGPTRWTGAWRWPPPTSALWALRITSMPGTSSGTTPTSSTRAGGPSRPTS
jgi:hypothetical protein